MHPSAECDLTLGTVLFPRQGVCTHLWLRQCKGIMTVGTLTPWSLCRLMFFAAYRAVLQPLEIIYCPMHDQHPWLPEVLSVADSEPIL